MFALIAQRNDGAYHVAQLSEDKFPVHIGLQWVDLSDTGATPETGWSAEKHGTWKLSSSKAWTFTPPPGPSLVVQAQLALHRSKEALDLAYETGQPCPPSLAAYRAALRDIVSGKTTPDDLPAWPPDIATDIAP